VSGERAQRVGVFGGTFDPVHVGHVVVATEVRSRLGLDRVLVVPAGDPWQKRGQVVASARDRLALVELAVAGVDGVEASAVEVEREGASVTADTLEALLGPGHELFLVLGADAVANMGTWRRLEETRDLATVDPLRDEIVRRWGDRALVAISLSLMTARMYPTLKYALGYGKACSKVVVAGTAVAPHSVAAAPLAA